MADKDSMSVEEILAACRRMDGANPGAAPPIQAAPPEAPAAPAPPAPKKAAAESPKPASAKPGEMSVADILAAARGEKASSAAESPAEPKKAAAAEATQAPAPAKKAGEMNVADILAAARGQKPAAASAAEPAVPKPAPKPKPAAAPAAKDAKKPTAPVALDTQSILAAARKGDKRGPMTKEEAKAKTAVAEKSAKPAKAKLQVPPMPEKPAYAVRPEPRPVAPAAQTRRSFFGSAVGVFLGSSLAVGFTTLTLTNLLWLLGLARFMFPNILTEPPTIVQSWLPQRFRPGSGRDEVHSAVRRVGRELPVRRQQQIYALKAVCTHLGCTPNWLERSRSSSAPATEAASTKTASTSKARRPRPLGALRHSPGGRRPDRSRQEPDVQRRTRALGQSRQLRAGLERVFSFQCSVFSKSQSTESC
jgi:cytochrome b6-f complex iron-sulfur subunit